MPQVGVMTNASCDLPLDLMNEMGILCVPNGLRVGAHLLLDDRSLQSTLDFFEREFDTGKEPADTIPAGPEEYLKLVQQQAIYQCDQLVIVSPLRALSKLYDNAHAGTVSIATASLEARTKAGRKDIFRVYLEDSLSLFSPHGLITWEAAVQVKQGADIAQVQQRLKELAPNTYGYYVANNLKYIASRARDKRDKPNPLALALGTMLDVKPIVQRRGAASNVVAKVRSFEAAASRVFERVQRMIEQQELLTPRVVIAYGGNPAELDQYPALMALRNTAASHEVQLAISPMSMSTGVYLGRGGLAVGVAARAHDF